MAEEKKTATALVVETREEPSLANVINVENYSKFTKLIHVTAWVMRFVRNLSAKRGERVTGMLQVSELSKAELSWVKVVQSKLRQQSNYQQLVRELKLVEINEILLCHRRLKNSDLSEEARKPIILPKEHGLTKLVVEQCHRKVFHSGLRAKLAELRARFWVPKGRQVVKKIIRSCVTCKKSDGRA